MRKEANLPTNRWLWLGLKGKREIDFPLKEDEETPEEKSEEKIHKDHIRLLPF